MTPQTNSKTYTWVLYLDLDNFKFVMNFDKYGHQVGDSILVSFRSTYFRIRRSIQNGPRCSLWHASSTLW
ncbi:diguanylate cyclase [Vibrio lentus]|nr:diguanylate cyclase [Vibrio lentus]